MRVAVCQEREYKNEQTGFQSDKINNEVEGTSYENSEKQTKEKLQVLRQTQQKQNIKEESMQVPLSI